MRARSIWLQVYRCIESIADLLQFTSFLEYREEKSQETRITCMHVTGANLGTIAYKDRLRAFRSAACTKF